FLREASLSVESGVHPGRQLLLTRPQTCIGRGARCDVDLSGDSGVEATHARIKHEGGQWVLSDAETGSGTQVNGQRITNPTALHTGDRIQIGGYVLVFEMKAKAKEPEILPTAALIPD